MHACIQITMHCKVLMVMLTGTKVGATAEAHSHMRLRPWSMAVCVYVCVCVCACVRVCVQLESSLDATAGEIKALTDKYREVSVEACACMAEACTQSQLSRVPHMATCHDYVDCYVDCKHDARQSGQRCAMHTTVCYCCLCSCACVRHGALQDLRALYNKYSGQYEQLTTVKQEVTVGMTHTQTHAHVDV